MIFLDLDLTRDLIVTVIMERQTCFARRITAHQLSEERQEKFHRFKKFEHPEATLAKMKVLS